MFVRSEMHRNGTDTAARTSVLHHLLEQLGRLRVEHGERSVLAAHQVLALQLLNLAGENPAGTSVLLLHHVVAARHLAAVSSNP